MRTANYTDFRKNLKRYMDSVIEDSDAVIIPRPEGEGVVLISLKEFNAIRETEYIISSPETMRRIHEAEKEFAAGGGTIVSSKEELDQFLEAL